MTEAAEDGVFVHLRNKERALFGVLHGEEPRKSAGKRLLIPFRKECKHFRDLARAARVGEVRGRRVRKGTVRELQAGQPVGDGMRGIAVRFTSRDVKSTPVARREFGIEREADG